MSIAPEPARNSTRAHFFFAQGAVRVSELALDNSEELEVLLVPVAELLELVDQGQIAHGAHVAAILLAWRRGLLA
jgi:hypothetical protein